MTDQLLLNQTDVVAGTPIHGNLVMINLSGRTVELTSMCHLDFVVILENGKIRQQVAFPAVACVRSPPWTMGPGLKRFPLTVETTYSGCADDPEDATAESPACRNGVRPPPLPPVATRRSSRHQHCTFRSLGQCW